MVFIYLAVSGLSCSMWVLLLQHMGSLVVVCGLSFPVVYGILFPWPGMNLNPPHSKADP